MLEGKEVEGTFDGGAGAYHLDADETGKIEVGMTYEKDLDGYAKVKSASTLETHIFLIAEKIAAKTKAEWDDKAVAGLKSLLGIK